MVDPQRELSLRTGAWYGDRRLALALPHNWRVEVRSPTARTALTDRDVSERLATPYGQPPLGELARGKRRPLIIVDDLNRATPASAVMPAVLRQLAAAGIGAEQVTLVMAPGTHGPPPPDAMAKKVGAEAATHCRTVVHECHTDLVERGRTSFGTPILVNRHVADADLVIGVGGILPNQTAGFGGGSKLALGVLGFRSIAGLHFGHEPLGWGKAANRTAFRADLDEIARRIGLRFTISLLINPEREVVDLRCGDPDVYYHEYLAGSVHDYQARPPEEPVDLVIANTYPNDQSLTFARMKGFAPLKDVPPHTSRVAIAACPEGLGFHGLYPFLNAPPHHRRNLRALRMRILVQHPQVALRKARRRLLRRRVAGPSLRDAWLLQTDPAPRLPENLPGIRLRNSWQQIVDGIAQEQSGKGELRVIVYPCASIQSLS